MGVSRVAALLVFSLATGSSLAADRDETAFLLTRVDVGSEYPLSWVQLRDAVSGDRVMLRYDPNDSIRYQANNFPRLLKVRPGRYYVSRIGTVFANLTPATFNEPSRLSEVEAGRINYIGDIIVNGAKAPVRVFRANYEHRFSSETLASALADEDMNIGKRPLTLAMPGMPTRALDAASVASDLNPGREANAGSLAGLYQLPDRAWWLRFLATGEVRTCAINSDAMTIQRGTITSLGDVTWSLGSGTDRVAVRSGRVTLAGPATEFTLPMTRDAPDLRCVPELYAP